MKIFGFTISRTSEEEYHLSRIEHLEKILRERMVELHNLGARNMELRTTITQLTHEKESALKNLDCVKTLYARAKTRSTLYRSLLRILTKEDNPTADSIISIVETMESLQEGIKKNAKMP